MHTIVGNPISYAYNFRFLVKAHLCLYEDSYPVQLSPVQVATGMLVAALPPYCFVFVMVLGTHHSRQGRSCWLEGEQNSIENFDRIHFLWHNCKDGNGKVGHSGSNSQHSSYHCWCPAPFDIPVLCPGAKKTKTSSSPHTWISTQFCSCAGKHSSRGCSIA